MQRFLPIPFFLLCTMLFASMAFADEWTAVNDEVEIDYQTSVIRVFTSAKEANILDTIAQKIVLSYIGTLTDGQDNKKLADIFKTRKVILAKIQLLIKQKTSYQRLPEKVLDGTYTGYYTFDLKLIKSILPDVNMPTP